MTETTNIKALRERLIDIADAEELHSFAIYLIDQLEAERQRADVPEACLLIEAQQIEIKRLSAELAALRGTQEPVATMHRVVNKLNGEIHPWICSMGVIDASESSTFRVEVQALFTRQPKPVVVLTSPVLVYSTAEDTYGEDGCLMIPYESAKKSIEAAGIVVKDGE